MKILGSTILGIDHLVSQRAIANPHNFALLLFPSTLFVVQIYHTFSFTTCFGLMGPP
jgi:hypothetical protein